MLVMSETLDADVFGALHNSFPVFNNLSKEQKDAGVQGRIYYKDVINEMLRRGRIDYAYYEQLHREGFDITELSAEVHELIIERTQRR